jgi:hypothetical protein
VPREERRSAELARTLDHVKQSTESVFWKKGVVAVVFSLNADGADILKEQLTKSGYRPVEGRS